MGSRIDAYAHEEAYLSEPYRPWGVSNIKAFYPFSLGTRRLCLKRRLLRRRIIPGYLRTPSPLAGVVPSVVFPSYGYRGGDASRDWLLLLRFHLPPQSFLPVGIGEVTLLTFGLASPATSHAGVTLYAFSWRRLLLATPTLLATPHVDFDLDFDLGPSRRLESTCYPRGASRTADEMCSHLL